MSINRRTFLQLSAAGAALGGLLPPATAETRNGMPYRRVGKTGELVSLLGVGGFHIGRSRLSEQDSIRLMRHAADEGVNFFDNAWDYHGGRSEERMGKALKDGYRDKVFLMTKVLDRTREGAQQQLEDSLRRLDVDVIDLWQIHSVKTPADPRLVYEEGPLEVAIKAREEGKVRYIGFTGHFTTSVHAEMIERGFDWATVQMPLSVFDYHYDSFTKDILPKAQEKDIGVIAMKTLGGLPGHLLEPGVVNAEEALRYSMSLPAATLVSGMDNMEHLKQNLAVAKGFSPLSDEEINALRTRAEEPGSTGEYEPHKTSWHRRLRNMA